MHSRDYLLLSIDSLRAHGVRSLLTMLGVIVGVLTVVLTLGIGAGTRQAIGDQIQALGSNLIVVNSGPPPGPRQQAIYLYPADAAAIRERCPLVRTVAPQQETRLPVSLDGAQLTSNFVMGVTTGYAHARRLTLTAGRFINETDDDQAAKVAVIGSSVRQYLLADGDPMGRRMLINGVDFEVIGVLDPKGDSPGLGPGMSTDDRIYIPLTALQARVLGTTDLRIIAMTTAREDEIPAAAAQIRRLLDERHPGNPFEIKTQLELMQTSSSISGVVTALLASLAAVSLIVGGIGIMNIMFVSVHERTREIGIRRAVGARRRHIVAQFLSESVLLGVAGGSAGGGAGVLLSWLAGFVLPWRVPILPEALVLALAASTVVGILSGLYPARRAAQLEVSDALRFE
jgi:putative ABC transport system permease protein